MKYITNRKREKRKWLAALCLCALCLSLCLPILAQPTLADEFGYLETDIKRIDAGCWGDGVYGDHIDSFGELRRSTLLAGGPSDGPGVIGWARYRLERGKYETFSCDVFCGNGTDGAAMRLRIFADDGQDPIYLSRPITRTTREFQLQADVRGVSVLQLEIIREDGGPSGGAGYLLFARAAFKRIAPLPAEAPSSTTDAPGPSSTMDYDVVSYVPVAGWYHLYQQFSSASLTGPSNYVHSFSGSPWADRTPVHLKDGNYYFEALRGGVYLALRRNGNFDAENAVWAGPDGVFATPDDRAAILRAGSYYCEESPGEWRFLAAAADFIDPRWAGAVPATTATTAAPAVTTGFAETTTNDYLSTGGADGPPKTGLPFNAGLLACVAVLFLGCVYCGFRLFRKEYA